MEPTKSAVVTGGASGLGAAIARSLAQAGYGVITVDLVEADDRPGIEHHLTDVRSLDGLQSAARKANELAPIRAWVNNAAIMRPTNLHATAGSTIEEVLDVNLGGYVRGSMVAVRSMLESDATQDGLGSIVNISSIHARSAYSDDMAYDVSKAGVEALTRYTAVEYGPVGLRCNAVAPGGINTPLSAAAFAKSSDPAAARKQAELDHPMGRMAAPEEIANVVAFLVSPAASFVNGAIVPVDGGLSASSLTMPIHPDLKARGGPPITLRD